MTLGVPFNSGLKKINLCIRILYAFIYNMKESLCSIRTEVIKKWHTKI